MRSKIIVSKSYKKKDKVDMFTKIDKERTKRCNTVINTVEEAISFFDWAKEHNGRDSCWSIQYWGFGEHFTHWSGDGTFIDFCLDKGQGIDWAKMQKILIESANNLREAMQNEYMDHKKEYRKIDWSRIAGR